MRAVLSESHIRRGFKKFFRTLTIALHFQITDQTLVLL